MAAAFETWRAAGVRLGVVTNGVHGQQVRKLTALGVMDDLECVVALDDVGVGKPDPRIFAAACSALGLPPSDVVYVGDDVIRDAVGTAAAGLTGVWLDRCRLAVPEGVSLVVQSLSDVLPLLL